VSTESIFVKGSTGNCTSAVDVVAGWAAGVAVVGLVFEDVCGWVAGLEVVAVLAEATEATAMRARMGSRRGVRMWKA
jgi:hypothetical protein